MPVCLSQTYLLVAVLLHLLVSSLGQRDMLWKPTAEEKAACKVTKDEYFQIAPDYDSQYEFFKATVSILTRI